MNRLRLIAYFSLLALLGANTLFAGSGNMVGPGSVNGGAMVDDDHILWGTGPDQVSLDDVPNGVTVKVGQNVSTTGAPTFTGLTLSATPLALTSGGLQSTTAAGGRATLGLGTIATQSAAAVAITGGSITGITPLGIPAGGTNAGTAAGARASLGAAASGSNSDITDLLGLTGALRAPSGILDSSGNELLTFTSQASAVNELAFLNAPTGESPQIQAVGDDADVSLTLMPQENGRVYVSNGMTRTSGLIVGKAGSGNHEAFLSLVGDTTNDAADEGLRISRGAGGPNADSQVTNIGDGNLSIRTLGAGSIFFGTDATDRMEITPSGIVEITNVQINGGSISGITTLGTAIGGTATSATPSNGQLLIGNASSGYDVANLTAGKNIAVTNGDGSITIGQKLGRTAISDTDYSVLSSDSLVAYTSISAARVVTLPTAASVGSGAVFIFKDESGSASALNTITIDGNGAETIDGAANTAIILGYGSVKLYCNGTAWFKI